MMRLDRFLASVTGASRSQASGLIRSGRVSINGVPVRQPDLKINEKEDRVSLDGKACEYRQYHYLLLDKPTGVLTACRDSRQKTVLDLIPEGLRRSGISPVGRLDKDTSGLLLLTDDGAFAHRIISPKYGVQKTYLAETEGILTEEDTEVFRKGVTLQDGTRCLPAKLTILSRQRCLVTVQEGKYHQVRRMLAAVEAPVVTLRRIALGGLRLGSDSKEGALRELTDQELCMMFKLVGLEK